MNICSTHNLPYTSTHAVILHSIYFWFPVRTFHAYLFWFINYRYSIFSKVIHLHVKKKELCYYLKWFSYQIRDYIIILVYHFIGPYRFNVGRAQHTDYVENLGLQKADTVSSAVGHNVLKMNQKVASWGPYVIYALDMKTAYTFSVKQSWKHCSCFKLKRNCPTMSRNLMQNTVGYRYNVLDDVIT